MRTARRAIIGTLATLATIAAVFFVGVGVAALVQGATYTEVLSAVTAWVSSL